MLQLKTVIVGLALTYLAGFSGLNIAHAQWQNLQGDLVMGSADCLSWGPDRRDCFAFGEDRSLHHTWSRDGETWGLWESLGGSDLDMRNVECVSWASERLDCFAVGRNTEVYHIWWNGSRWSGWENVSQGRILGARDDNPLLNVSGIDCTSWQPNRIDCFLVVEGDLQHFWWAGSGWGWEDLGGRFSEPPTGAIVFFPPSRPECTSWAPNRIDCVVVSSQQGLHYISWNGRRWSRWRSLGGESRKLRGTPSCISLSEDRFDCFVLSEENGFPYTLAHLWGDGSDWNWEDLGGSLENNPPHCTTWEESRIDCFAFGAGSENLDHWWYHGAGWGFESLDAPVPVQPGYSDLSCLTTRAATLDLDCFFVALDVEVEQFSLLRKFYRQRSVGGAGWGPTSSRDD